MAGDERDVGERREARDDFVSGLGVEGCVDVDAVADAGVFEDVDWCS